MLTKFDTAANTRQDIPWKASSSQSSHLAADRRGADCVVLRVHPTRPGRVALGFRNGLALVMDHSSIVAKHLQKEEDAVADLQASAPQFELLRPAIVCARSDPRLASMPVPPRCPPRLDARPWRGRRTASLSSRSQWDPKSESYLLIGCKSGAMFLYDVEAAQAVWTFEKISGGLQARLHWRPCAPLPPEPRPSGR